MNKGFVFSAILLAISVGVLFILNAGQELAFGLSSDSLPVTMQVSTVPLLAYVTTDKPYYQVGPQQEIIVKIYGNIPNLGNDVVTVTVKTPQNEYKSIVTNTSTGGSFSIPYVVGARAYGGLYKVTASYHGGQVSTSFLVSKDFVWEA